MNKITELQSTTVAGEPLPYAVVRVVSCHPDWDEDGDDAEFEVSRHATEAAAQAAATLLGCSSGGPCNRAYSHCVRA